MKTLKLTLKKRWFDMIASGEKKEEYRQEGQWILSRLKRGEIDRHYDAVKFTHGYAKDAPTVTLRYLGWDYGWGKPEWGGGGKQGMPLIVIKLGEIIP